MVQGGKAQWYFLFAGLGDVDPITIVPVGGIMSISECEVLTNRSP